MPKVPESSKLDMLWSKVGEMENKIRIANNERAVLATRKFYNNLKNPYHASVATQNSKEDQKILNVLRSDCKAQIANQINCVQSLKELYGGIDTTSGNPIQVIPTNTLPKTSWDSYPANSYDDQIKNQFDEYPPQPVDEFPDFALEVPNNFTENDMAELQGAYSAERQKLTDLFEERKQQFRDNNQAQIELRNSINNGTTTQADGDLQMHNLQRQSRKLNNKMNRIKGFINGLEGQYNHDVQLMQDFQNENAETRRRNYETIQQHLHEFNSGRAKKLYSEKQPNETEEEYLARLRSLSAEVQAGVHFDNEAYIVKKFKDRMKEIERRDYVIEQVANTVPLEIKEQILKEWARIKGNFTKKFGVYNHMLKSVDIIQFLEENTYPLANAPAYEHDYTLEPHPVGNLQAEIPNTPMGNEGSAMASTVTPNQIWTPQMVGAYLHKHYSVGKLRECIGVINTGINSPFSTIKTSEHYKRELISLIREEICNAKNNNPNQTIENIFGVGDLNYNTGGNGMKQQKAPLHGKGLVPEDIPKVVHFGRVFIMLQKLYYDNVLSVKQSKGLASIPQFNSTKVSDRLVHILMNLVGNIPPKSSEIASLPNEERMLYDRLIYLAGLNKSTVNTGEKSAEGLSKRLQLIHGEIDIGNNNPELKKEIHKIVHTLHDMKVINRKDLKSYLSQF